MNTTNDRALRVIIAGGGTGGHIFPALSIAQELVRRVPVEILFIGATGKMEMEKVPEAGFAIKGIDIAGFNRSSILKNIALPWKLIKSFWQVHRYVSNFAPDALIGVGGYSSFPVLRYGQFRGLPTFIHESNSFAGKANQWLGKKATKVFVATDGMQQFFPASKIAITGNPVRKDITEVAAINPAEAKRFFGLDPDKKTVLAIGGSLGARSINTALAQGLQRLQEAGLQLIWQTGRVDAQQWQDAAKGCKGIYVNEFIRDMKQAYAAADLVISRAGAMAIAELCIVQKPVVFVPFPYAAEDHQTANARHLVEKQAALMVKDADASEKLVDTLLTLAADDVAQGKLAENIGTQKQLNADEKVVDHLLACIGKK